MGGSFGTSLHPISTSPESPSPTRNAPQIAEAFSPRTMAAADAGDKPTRLSATLARVRAQWQMKEKTKRPWKPEKENTTHPPSPSARPQPCLSSPLSLSKKWLKSRLATRLGIEAAWSKKRLSAIFLLISRIWSTNAQFSIVNYTAPSCPMMTIISSSWTEIVSCSCL